MSPRKKEDWIEVQEAAALLSEKSGREISPDYVRLIAHKGHITWRKKDGRTNEYLKSDVEAYRVRQNRKRDVEDTQPRLPAVKPDEAAYAG